jgi:putative FmdB family regulatory protein
MPTYDYVCSSCEHTFDELLKIDDRNLPETQPCPVCNKIGTVSLKLSSPSLVSPFRVDGLKKPSSQFKDRISQIKSKLGRHGKNLKDY